MLWNQINPDFLVVCNVRLGLTHTSPCFGEQGRPLPSPYGQGREPMEEGQLPPSKSPVSSAHSPLVRTGHMVPTHSQGKLGNDGKHLDT